MEAAQPKLRLVWRGFRRVGSKNGWPIIYLPSQLRGHVGRQVYIIVYEVEDGGGGGCEC